MPEFEVPFRLTLQGRLVIEADSAEDARAAAERNEWEDDSFFGRAEHVDWEVTGRVREVK